MKRWWPSQNVQKAVLFVLAVSSFLLYLSERRETSQDRFAEHNASAWQVISELKENLDVITEDSRAERSWLATQTPDGADPEWLERVIKLERSWAGDAGPTVTSASSQLRGYRNAAGVEELPADPFFTSMVREASPARSWLPVVELLLNMVETIADNVDSEEFTNRDSITLAIELFGETSDMEVTADYFEVIPTMTAGLERNISDLNAVIAETDVVLGLDSPP